MKSGRIYRWEYSFTHSLSTLKGIVVKSLAGIFAVLTMQENLPMPLIYSARRMSHWTDKEMESKRLKYLAYL